MKRCSTVLFSVCLCGLLTLPALAAPADVPEDLWYAPSAEQTLQAGWLDAQEDGDFAPDTPISRRDVILALWRMRGCPADVSSVPFTDIPEDAPYMRAAAWASGHYIVLGFPDGTFRPEAPVTRLQMACFLYRYNKWCGTGAPSVWPYGLPFSDTADITGDAETALGWCRLVGIMSGYDDGTFRPSESVSRAQAAVALCRLFDWQQPHSAVLASN